MKLEELADEIVETDVLIIGGGLAGCMGAIQANERGVDVVVMEKAAIRRSGEVGRGIDHYPIAHPYFTGVAAEEYGLRSVDSRKTEDFGRESQLRRSRRRSPSQLCRKSGAAG